MRAIVYHIEDAFKSLQSGDEKGLSYYFNKYYSSLSCFSHSITSSESASEDIVTESFLTLWNNRNQLKQESHVKHFLFCIVRNRSINYLREKKRLRQRENTLLQLILVSERSVLEKLIETETYKEMYLLYQRLPKKCKVVFELFYIEKKPVKEIAKELSISVNTVKSQKQRALQLLKEYRAELNLIFGLCYLLLNI